MAKSGKTSKFLTGAAIGAATGAAAGVLFAPKAGKDTRKDITDKADKLKHDASSAIETGKNKIDHLKNKTKGKVNETKKKIYNKADEIEKKSRAKL